jgi:hypothetical protein
MRCRQQFVRQICAADTRSFKWKRWTQNEINTSNSHLGRQINVPANGSGDLVAFGNSLIVATRIEPTYAEEIFNTLGVQMSGFEWVIRSDHRRRVRPCVVLATKRNSMQVPALRLVHL